MSTSRTPSLTCALRTLGRHLTLCATILIGSVATTHAEDGGALELAPAIGDGLLAWAVMPSMGTSLTQLQTHVDAIAMQAGAPSVPLEAGLADGLGLPDLSAIDQTQPVVVVVRAAPGLVGEPLVTVLFTAADAAAIGAAAVSQGQVFAQLDGVAQIGTGVTGHEPGNAAVYQTVLASSPGSEDATMAIEVSTIHGLYRELARAGIGSMLGQIQQMQGFFQQQGMAEMGEMMGHAMNLYMLGGMQIFGEIDRITWTMDLTDEGAAVDWRLQAVPGTSLEALLASGHALPDPTTSEAWQLIGHQPGSMRSVGFYQGQPMATWLTDLFAAVDADPLSTTPLPPVLPSTFTDVLHSLDGAFAGVVYAGPNGVQIQDMATSTTSSEPMLVFYERIGALFDPAGPFGQVMAQMGAPMTVSMQRASRQVSGVDVHTFTFEMPMGPGMGMMGAGPMNMLDSVEMARVGGLDLQRTGGGIEELINHAQAGSAPEPLPLAAAERYGARTMLMDMDVPQLIVDMMTQMGQPTPAAPVGGIPSQMAFDTRNGVMRMELFVPQSQVQFLVTMAMGTNSGPGPAPF